MRARVLVRVIRSCVFLGALVLSCAAFAAPKTQKNVVYATIPAAKGGPKTELKLDITWPEEAGPHPCFVFIHGGAWAMGDKKEVGGFVEMAKQGWVVASVNYRLTAKGKCPFPAQIQDCKAAIRFLHKNAATYGINPDRIIVGGGSAGGHLCALLGVTNGIDPFVKGAPKDDPESRIAGVVDMFGPTDFQAMMGPALAAEMQNPGKNPAAAPIYALFGSKDPKVVAAGFAPASPTTYATKERAKSMPPFLILHSKGDPLVPFSQSVLLDQKLRDIGVDCTLKLYDFNQHALPPAAGKDIQDFLQKCCK